MFKILIDAALAVLRWLTGGVVMKGLVGAGILAAGAALLSVLIALLPGWFSLDSVTGATSVFTPEIWYFIDVFKVQDGLALTLSAYATRFLINRLPIFG